MKKILLIEDNQDVRENTAEILELAGYKVFTAENGKVGVTAAQTNKPDLIICDIMMPVLDGYGVLHLLGKNQETASIPFIFLTAKAERSDLRKGMEMGADDYITKPFSMRELVARVQTVLRRPRTGPAIADNAGDEPARVFGRLRVDPAGQRVHLDGTEVALTPTERDLLMVLARRPTMAFSRAQLIQDVWGPDWFGDEHLVDVHIAHLRRKLGDDPETGRYITTVRGVGYRMGPG